MKMKRLIAAALALLLLAALMPASLADAAEHTHQWVQRSRREPTCTAKGKAVYVCSICGETKEETLPAAGHKWGRWKETKKATCTERGEETRTCKVCGRKDTRRTDRAAHTYGAWTVIREAACTEDGVRTRTCEVCGHVDEGRLKKTGHSFGEWEVTEEPADFSTGTRVRACEVCGELETEEVYPYPTYKNGDVGSGVKELQKALNAAGYDCGKADGAFGKKTEAAVKAIEAAHGAFADGIAWPGVQKWLAVASDGSDGGNAAQDKGLVLTVEQTAGEAEAYAIGDEVGFAWTLTNTSSRDLILDNVFLDWGGDGLVSLCDTPIALLSEGGNTVSDTWTAELDQEWLGDGVWELRFFGRGYAEGGEDAEDYTASNFVAFSLPAIRRGGAPAGGINKLMKNGPVPVPEDGGAEPGIRTLEILKQTKNEDDYYDGAVIPVKMRLTIDSFDEYDFLGVTQAPGDQVEVGEWADGILESDGKYDLTYTMVLDPKKTGWATRDVTVRLRSRTFNTVEEEVCQVRPPFTYPTVTLAGGDSHVIDYPAFLYLTVNRSEIAGFPGEGVDVPITVTTDAASRFSDLKLVVEEYWTGKGYRKSTFKLTNRMEAHETRSFMTHWSIWGLENRWEDYEVKLYVTGLTDDAKGYPQLITSLGRTLPMKLTDPMKQEGMLELSYSIAPNRVPIWAKDEVTLYFTVKNIGKEPVENVRVAYGDLHADLEKTLGSIEPVGNGGKLAPNESATSMLRFNIPQDLIDAKQFAITFLARGETAETHTPVRSKALWIVRGIDKNMPKDGLKLTAAVSEPMDAYPAGKYQKCVLSVLNTSDRAVRALRVYAVGDNRGERSKSDAKWFDLGHGAKGWQVTNRIVEIPSGQSLDIEADTMIPEGLDASELYRACWIVDAELADYTPVRSNMAGVSLPVQETPKETKETEPSLELRARVETETPESGLWQDGDKVTLKFQAIYWGKEELDRIEVAASNLFSDTADETVAGYDTYSYEDEIEYTLDASRAHNGVCSCMLTATAYRKDGSIDAESIPCVFTFVMDQEEEEETFEIGDLELNVSKITPTPESGAWQYGDKVSVWIDAEYKGEETPAKVEVWVFDSYGVYLPQYTWTNKNSKDLEIGYPITLEEDMALNGTCRFIFTAMVYVDEDDVHDNESMPVILDFDMEEGKTETQINWAAIKAAQEAYKEEENAKKGGETPEGKEAAGPEGTEVTEPEGTEKTEPEGTEVTEPEGTEKTEPEGTEKTEPEGTEKTEPEGTEKTEPEGTEKTEPEGKEKTEPEGTEKTEPEGTEKTEPEGKEKTEPEGMEKTELEGTEKTEPEGKEKTEPEGKEKTEPEGTEKTEPEEKYTETDVTIPGENYDIPATVCLPAGEGPFPAVVMLHGTGSTRDEAGDGYKYAAPVLAEKYGIATIRIDFPGNGDSTADYMLYTYKSAVADAKAAAEYMAGLENIDGDAIGVMGWSQGGTDALLACAWEPETFKSLVTWAGAPDMMADGFFSEEDYEEAKANGFFVMEFDWREDLNVSLEWCDEVANTDVLAEFSAGYDGPVLAIAGTEDTTVDPVWSEKIAAASANEKSGTYFIEGMDHTFNVFAEEDLHSLYEAADATGAFFADTLG